MPMLAPHIEDRLRAGDMTALIPVPPKRVPRAKLLVVDPHKCNGCRLCELACSLKCTGQATAERSRIRIWALNREGMFFPAVCQQCSDAPCQAACPKEAIQWDDTWGRIRIDDQRCVACQMCVAACPFGAIGFDKHSQSVFKCEVCDGAPQCVHFCEPGALQWIDAQRLPQTQTRQAARRLHGALQRNAALRP